MSTFAAVLITLLAPLSVALVLITMPGTAVLLAVAAVLQVWRGDLIGWDTLAWCTGFWLVGEIIEIVASALGAKKAGGSRRAAIGSILGALVGAIGLPLLLPFLFPLSALAGAALGAGLGAVLAERSLPEKTWKHSMKVGTGAAAGRLVATVCKTAIATGVALVVTVAVWW